MTGSVSKPPKPKDDKSSDVDAKVSKLKSKPPPRLQKKYGFVPTYHHYGVVGHIRPNCSLLSQEPKLVTRNPSRNTNVPKFVHVCHFCGVTDHISPNCHKLKFKHSIIQSRTGDDVLPTTSLEKNFVCF